MQLLRITLAALLCLSLGGCMAGNLSASESLRDSIVNLCDELRWSRIDLAIDRVAPSFRNDFSVMHAGWGRDVQIAETELLRVNMETEGDGASSMVSVRWYNMSSMTVHETMVEQTWLRAGRHFMLTDARVVDGDSRLFREPPEVDAAAKGSL